MNLKTANIPSYLKCYIVDQHYDRYTPRDHETWRYIMEKSKAFLKDHAHDVYLEGLEKTGIPQDVIPKISDMDRILSQFGWGAVCVRGFIPPLAFLDFQARKILPIAADMRTIDHLFYTPAPDIVHEAAGHAPILADPQYANYLTAYALIARKAIYSAQDLHLYEAIRVLSDLKENPDATKEHIDEAQKRLEQTIQDVSWTSEATYVSRLFWWTAEYGLIGDLEHPKIYGAGLLSSLSEGHNCLKDPHIKKIPLSIDCIQMSYDITKPQPQLYVAKDFQHLMDVLEELDDSLAYKKGGLDGLKKAKRSETLTTTVLDTGLQISGILTLLKEDLSYLKWTGPTQLAVEDHQLSGHSTERHPQGFSTLLGRLKAYPQKSIKLMSDEELYAVSAFEFISGITIKGLLKNILRHPQTQTVLLLTFDQVTVFDDQGHLYFEPSWGEYDLAVGESVLSVFGGPADWEAFGFYDMGQASTAPGRKTPYSEKEKKVFELYHLLREMRDGKISLSSKEMEELTPQIKAQGDWLLEQKWHEFLSQR